jgi:hypothetical protein
MTVKTIHESARDVPVVCDVDLCVVGGSATGVFAAVTAARLGLRVALIESHGFFGGVATASLVSVWHSILDAEHKRPIIGGLTVEFAERLKRRRGVVTMPGSDDIYYILNTEETKIELDELVREARVRPFLHARFADVALEDGQPVAAIIEDKSGRRAIAARVFIDATGDGDLVARAGLPFEKRDDLQPPTTCFIVRGLEAFARHRPKFHLGSFLHEGRTIDMPHGFLWSRECTGHPDDVMVAGTRVPGADCSDADQLTAAEMEGRRQVRLICDLLRAEPEGTGVALTGLPATIGIRETRHAVCLHRLTEQEVLEGVRFDDAIANGSYRVDVHHSDKPGLTFRYLDGREIYAVPGRPSVRGRWREERAANPTFYQVPYRCLVPRGATNVLVAGRLMDADRGAYGAVRVMVTCNQTGEAAGAAASLALSAGRSVADVNTTTLRETLRKGGSVIL